MLAILKENFFILICILCKMDLSTEKLLFTKW